MQDRRFLLRVLRRALASTLREAALRASMRDQNHIRASSREKTPQSRENKRKIAYK